ncbi:hypothetical protein K438DRAFT_1964312 [Mycena galopus ATCC 62051]|nr:hypothetical protein K438DRAFT_1964312 [Mycena galopus ATCC 62051]
MDKGTLKVPTTPKLTPRPRRPPATASSSPPKQSAAPPPNERTRPRHQKRGALREQRDLSLAPKAHRKGHTHTSSPHHRPKHAPNPQNASSLPPSLCLHVQSAHPRPHPPQNTLPTAVPLAPKSLAAPSPHLLGTPKLVTSRAASPPFARSSRVLCVNVFACRRRAPVRDEDHL